MRVEIAGRRPGEGVSAAVTAPLSDAASATRRGEQLYGTNECVRATTLRSADCGGLWICRGLVRGGGVMLIKC
eukprot:1581302-Prymnesium_polylepis.2